MPHVIANRCELAGTLASKPEYSGPGRYLRARLAQDWEYDSKGKTETHRQFLQLQFAGDTKAMAETFEQGDNIWVLAQYIRRSSGNRDSTEGSIHEFQVFQVHRIQHNSRSAASLNPPRPIHQSTLRANGASTRAPQFLEESANAWVPL
jgi:hypothetical protein